MHLSIGEVDHEVFLLVLHVGGLEPEEQSEPVEQRERADFCQLQEQADLILGQERLEFLYDSGLAVGKGSSGFKALESIPTTQPKLLLRSDGERLRDERGEKTKQQQN
ncbi:pre-mRNA splicing factor domain-containing protein [Perilla frutescens var. hirtella]|uniref:Pre-mRNA splicing factor domain-containing protein n=1 Tax=Perilla frutescens var. hirtella TaxID=608512 RepID=A0AAD4J6X5_PERFH|nr:pre-mRNA splicing factor domain-containing protein [Perilla frutescens var. hirtella]